MCGIAGFIGFKNNKELAELANEIQKHRGPDNQSVWMDEFIALSHQRLSIIDLSDRADQPFEKDNLIIVFNGEIYNYQELKKEHLNDINFITTSDTEVVLEMYKKFGEKALGFFVGMFAFAIYDKKNNTLFAARDHFGIKPFFYSKTPEGFAFASELKTLTKIPGFDKEINIKALINSLNYLWIPEPETIFKNIHKLPPAHYMKIDKSLNVKIHRYWNLEEAVDSGEEPQIISNLKSILEKSIERHMVADVPVSAFLSGGLDSSLIAVMSKKYVSKLSTYTIATEKKDKKVESMPSDEKYAKLLADKYNFDHHEIVINANIIKELPFIVKTLGEPIGDPAAINTYLICKSAKEKGEKVLLSGMGADEIFFGYRRMKATLLAQKYKKIPVFFRKIIEAVVLNLPVRAFGKGLRLVRWAKKFISFANLPLSEAYRMSYSYYSPKELKALMKNKHNETVDEIIENHSKIFMSKYKNDPVNQMCHTDINMFMVGLNLTYTDRASMAASVEVRVPFIDKKVIEYAMKIPGKFKFHKKQSKYILKKVAEYFLPSKIIYRPKASFGAPIRSWISNDLKDMVDDLLSVENIKKRGLFDPEFIREMIRKDREGIEDNAYRIYQLLTIELWFKEFIDK